MNVYQLSWRTIQTFKHWHHITYMHTKRIKPIMKVDHTNEDFMFSDNLGSKASNAECPVAPFPSHLISSLNIKLSVGPQAPITKAHAHPSNHLLAYVCLCLCNCYVVPLCVHISWFLMPAGRLCLLGQDPWGVWQGPMLLQYLLQISQFLSDGTAKPFRPLNSPNLRTYIYLLSYQGCVTHQWIMIWLKTHTH